MGKLSRVAEYLVERVKAGVALQNQDSRTCPNHMSVKKTNPQVLEFPNQRWKKDHLILSGFLKETVKIFKLLSWKKIL